MFPRLPSSVWFWSAIFSVLSGTGTAAFGQIQWRSPDAPPFVPEKDVAGALGRLAGEGVLHVAVQLSKRPSDGDRAALAVSGVRLGAPLGDRCFFASIDARILDGRGRSVGTLISGVQAIDPRWKLHPAFSDADQSAWTTVGSAPSAGGKGEPVVALYVLLHGDVPNDALASATVQRHGGLVRATIGTINGLVIEMPRVRAIALAGEDSVQWIEPALPMLSPTNVENRALTHANQAQAAPYNLNGAGVTAFVFDGGSVRTTHQDLAGRAIVIDGSGQIDHATHVAGTIAGSGAASGGNNRGMAPGASILSAAVSTAGTGWLYTNPSDIEADYTSAFSQGADIANNSIGTNVNNNGFPCSWHGDYGVTDSVIDAIVRGSQGVSGGVPYRIVWAAGNERGGRCDTGGFRTIGPPAGAKNHLSIGAVNANDDSMTGFSGWGPTDDGRLKPDFCAPGCQSSGDFGVTSCSSASNNAYSVNCGTSMAAPTATGISSLLLEDWARLRPGSPWPRNSTLKVLLAQSATDLGNVGPDYKFGYGSIRADAAVDLLRAGTPAEGQLGQDFVDFYTVTVAPGSPALVLTAAWDDAPGTANVIPSLINDLDVRVYSPTGARAFPWTLAPASPNTLATRTVEDHLNNIEQVRVDAPAAGVWTVEIHGTNIPQGPQPYSIVASNTTFAFSGSVSLSAEVVTLAPDFIDPGTPTPTAIQVSIQNDTLVAGSPALHYRVDGGVYTAITMTHAGGGLYEAVLPGFACGDAPEYYFTVNAVLLGQVILPDTGTTDPYTAQVGVPIITSFDMEAPAGWVGGVTGDTAHLGQWERGIPQATVAQPGADHTDPPGQNCWVTGRQAGADQNSFDVDGGRTTLLSPVIDLLGADASMRLGYWRWYSNSAGSAPNLDTFTVDISANAGAAWTSVEIVGPAGPGTSGGWLYHEVRITDFVPLTATMQLRFIASDVGSTSTIEAAIDDVSFYLVECNDACPADFDGNGTREVADVFAFLSAWFALDPSADFDGVGGIGVPDIFAFLSAWFAGCG